MSLLQILVVVSGLLCSLVAFVVMRYPQARRSQFRSADGFSVPTSIAVALIVASVFFIIAYRAGS